MTPEHSWPLKRLPEDWLDTCGQRQKSSEPDAGDVPEKKRASQEAETEGSSELSPHQAGYRAYLAVIEQAQIYFFLVKVNCGSEFSQVSSDRLDLAVVDAYRAGLRESEISQALAIGEFTGVRGIVKPLLLEHDNDAVYWQAVREEAEAFWARRYDPDAPEDW